ncbi:PACE efflux transporter [Oceaniglobus roseus]|uniref:PACE efflux transporter n=1 Tax=Oceaniglobus roseus TaxID=1737570 RepID=UPI000C7E92DC|nr:PACE efflux transporter [Kandeliimicrobium roseum]
MRTTFDRIRQAVSFEIVGLLIATPLFARVFAHPLDEIGLLALFGATVATLWNYFYNLGFDHALRCLTGRTTKTVSSRVVHAILFEATLLALLLPLFAWWLGISLVEAVLMDLSFAAFYAVYAFVFTWAYDTLFPAETRAEGSGRH